MMSNTYHGYITVKIDQLFQMVIFRWLVNIYMSYSLLTLDFGDINGVFFIVGDVSPSENYSQVSCIVITILSTITSKCSLL